MDKCVGWSLPILDGGKRILNCFLAKRRRYNYRPPPHIGCSSCTYDCCVKIARVVPNDSRDLRRLFFGVVCSTPTLDFGLHPLSWKHHIAKVFNRLTHST